MTARIRVTDQDGVGVVLECTFIPNDDPEVSGKFSDLLVTEGEMRAYVTEYAERFGWDAPLVYVESDGQTLCVDWLNGNVDLFDWEGVRGDGTRSYLVAGSMWEEVTDKA